MRTPASPFPGESSMAAPMAGFDWASSPLGSPEGWSGSLQSACRICLTSRFPMIVWWGPELRFFYNDAYLPLLGTKHPALGKRGQEVWAEIWHIVGPMLESVLATGQATWSDDMLLPMERHGYWEETYWTYSYSPLHDEDGAVRGVFAAVTETTQRVVSERRLAALQELGAQAGTARTVTEASHRAIASLAGTAAGGPGRLAAGQGATRRYADGAHGPGGALRRTAVRKLAQAAGRCDGATAARRDRRAASRGLRPVPPGRPDPHRTDRERVARAGPGDLRPEPGYHRPPLRAGY